MVRTKYFIKSIKYENYYQKHLFDKQKHFVEDIKDAQSFASRKIANNTLEKFNNKDGYEIVAIKCGK